MGVLLAGITNNADVAFALGLVVLILGVIGIVTTGLTNLLAWAVSVAGLAMVLVWWPD